MFYVQALGKRNGSVDLLILHLFFRPEQGYIPYMTRVTQSGQSVQTSTRSSWSPAQLIALAAGLFLVVSGGVALARTGLSITDVPATHATAGGLPYTCLSAVVQLVAGVLLLAGGAFPDTARAVMAVFGAIFLAFGLIVAIDPTPFANLWGYDESSGVMMALIGGILLLAAATSPIFGSRRSTVEKVVSDDRTDVPSVHQAM